MGYLPGVLGISASFLRVGSGPGVAGGGGKFCPVSGVDAVELVEEGVVAVVLEVVDGVAVVRVREVSGNGYGVGTTARYRNKYQFRNTREMQTGLFCMHGRRFTHPSGMWMTCMYPHSRRTIFHIEYIVQESSRADGKGIFNTDESGSL